MNTMPDIYLAVYFSKEQASEQFHQTLRLNAINSKSKLIRAGVFAVLTECEIEFMSDSVIVISH